MPLHQLFSLRNAERESVAPPVVAPYAVPELSLTADDAVEDYLDRVCADLMMLPYTRRQEIRRELRQHLEAMIAAHEELGEERDTVTANALRQFGVPKTIASEYQSVFPQETEQEAVPPSTAKTALRAFLWYGGATLAFGIANGYLEQRDHFLYVDNMTAFNANWWLKAGVVLVLPAILIGRKLAGSGSRRAGLISFGLLSALTGMAWGLLEFIEQTSPFCGDPNLYTDHGDRVYGHVVLWPMQQSMLRNLAVALLTYLVFGTVAATLFGFWYRRPRRQMRQIAR